MGSKPKAQNRREHRGSWRCDEKTWQEACEMIREAQAQLGSIRLVATRIGMNEGWAKSVLDHHTNIVTEASMRRLADLVSDLRLEAASKAARATVDLGVVKVGGVVDRADGLIKTPRVFQDLERQAEREDEVRRNLAADEFLARAAEDVTGHLYLAAMVEIMRRSHGLTNPQIATVFGYASWKNLHTTMQRVSEIVPVWRLDRGAEALLVLQSGDPEQIERLFVKAIHPAMTKVKFVQPEPVSPESVAVEPEPVLVTEPTITRTGPDPLAREGRISHLRERLTEVAMGGFDEIMKHEPEFLRVAWKAKQAELLQFIQSLE